MSVTSEIIGLAILLLLSSFFSASEFAFVIANKIKIELRSRKNNVTAKNVFYYINNPQIFYSTILISNNVVNIAFSSLIAFFLGTIFKLGELEILLITTVLLLLIGELIPKYLAREFADVFILLAAIPIRVITIVIYPVVKLISTVSSALFMREEDEILDKEEFFDKEQFQTILSESTEAGHVQQEEFDIINTILELREQKVYDVMTPRTDVVGVEINSSVEDVINAFVESGYSKLPVFEENLDNIKGIVITYDMFKYPENLSSIIREVGFVPETKQILDTLNELLAKQMSIAIVVDEFGGTAGIVTVEDIIEEMLGEIRDEYDIDEDIFKKIDEFSYIVSAKVEVDTLNDQEGLNIPEGDYATIGGFITSALGRIPQKGEKVTIDDLQFLIIKSDKTKLDLVRMWISTPSN
ncbi:MAG: hemolysin family protein [Bacteroidetes bacterium]|nr:hemolysin family protein [Bacteroidota bacterium]